MHRMKILALWSTIDIKTTWKLEKIPQGGILTSSNVRPSGRSGTKAASAVSTIGSAGVDEGLDKWEGFLVCWTLVAGFKIGPAVFRLARSTLDLLPQSSASDREPFPSFGLLQSEFSKKSLKNFFIETLEGQVGQGLQSSYGVLQPQCKMEKPAG